MTHSKQVSARGLLILFVLALCFTADQLSKKWALTHLTHGQPQPFIPGFIKLTLTTNPGAAFSIGSQNGQIMGVVATVLTLVILAWIVKRAIAIAPLPVVEQIGMGCLLGGALGNLADRYTLGQVTDFLEFVFISFPVFNVADALIDVGIGCLFIAMYFCKNAEQAKENDSTCNQSHSSSAANHSMVINTDSNNTDVTGTNISSSAGGATNQTNKRSD